MRTQPIPDPLTPYDGQHVSGPSISWRTRLRALCRFQDESTIGVLLARLRAAVKEA